MKNRKKSWKCQLEEILLNRNVPARVGKAQVSIDIKTRRQQEGSAVDVLERPLFHFKLHRIFMMIRLIQITTSTIKGHQMELSRRTVTSVRGLVPYSPETPTSGDSKLLSCLPSSRGYSEALSRSTSILASSASQRSLSGLAPASGERSIAIASRPRSSSRTEFAVRSVMSTTNSAWQRRTCRSC